MVKKITLLFVLVFSMVGCTQPLTKTQAPETSTNETSDPSNAVVIKNPAEVESSDTEKIILTEAIVSTDRDVTSAELAQTELLDIDSPLTLSVTEAVGENQGYLSISIATEEDYSCLGYDILSDTTTTAGVITTTMYGVQPVNGACLTALGPASYSFTLKADPGVYELNLVYGEKTDRYYLTVSTETLELTTLNSSFSDATKTTVERFPDDRYIVDCLRYYVLKPDPYCQELYDAFATAGAVPEVSDATTTSTDTTEKIFRYSGDSAVLEKILANYADDNYTLELKNLSGTLVRYASYNCSKVYDQVPEHFELTGALVDDTIAHTNIHLQIPSDWYVLQRIPDDEDNQHIEATAGVILHTAFCDKIEVKVTNGDFAAYQTKNEVWNEGTNRTIQYEPITLPNATWYRVHFVKSDGTSGYNAIIETLAEGHVLEIQFPFSDNDPVYSPAIENLAAHFSFAN